MTRWYKIEGTPFEAGRALGRHGRSAVETFIVPSPAWRQVESVSRRGLVKDMAERTRNLFPLIMEEIEGLAAGLERPFLNVFAWQCRGELLPLATEGCTTLMVPGAEPRIGHNEDGSPLLRGHCFMIDYYGSGRSAGFKAFCYPGTIPGTAFGWNDVGFAQTVNNLRLHIGTPEIPRAVLARASLAQPSVMAAVELLRTAPASAGFHFALGDCRSKCITSIEFGGGHSSVRRIDQPEAHSNHLTRGGEIGLPETKTSSSLDRQARASSLLRMLDRDLIEILRDTNGPGLPIFRTGPDDPDNENTICTAIFNLAGSTVECDIHWV